MKFLTNTITIAAEITAIVFSIIWLRRTGEEEPIIAIVLSSAALLTSLLLKFSSRPKVMLHHIWTDSGRNPQGYTANNPPVIHVGVDNPEMYWRLSWNYRLEIRNNSSHTAYSIEIKYLNLPPNTFIEGNFGKIEPFQTHELREFRVKIVQNVTGTYIDADNYLENNPNILTENFKVIVKYKDENGFPFRTIYSWTKDKNKLSIF